ncbi:Calcium-transporting ATPase 2 [Metarhizium brunneum]|uniref:Calcium-transporting ATPase n=1 Tax=Metarhizium brunneum TaxID=500148 RepID=A0A7D5V3R2_9HYPO|nr:Calcium-transporting ATPase 2 [Metarhizium brunneum]
MSQILKRPLAPAIRVDVSAIQHNHGDNPSALQSRSNATSNTLDVPTPTPTSSPRSSSKPTISDGDSSNRRTGDNLSPLHDINKSSASVLWPDPGEEALFNIENNPFAFCPGQLAKLINPKSLAAFVALGGLPGLEKGLQSHRQGGLSVDERHVSSPITFDQATSTLPSHGSPTHSQHDPNPPPVLPKDGPDAAFADRKRVFGENRLPERKSKSFLQLAWIALQDRVLILLCIAAVISLALGLYQTFGQTEHQGAKVEWVEGVAIIVAIAIVVVAGALNDWQKERQFRKLNVKKEDRLVKVIRSGRPMTISVHDVLVGDVMLLEPGDVVPVDGVFIDGHSLSCDESPATGESDLVKKVPAEDVSQALREEAPDTKKLDPFVISGSKVLDGVGSFLITSVGPNSSHGRTMMSLQGDSGLTPLQSKLNVLAGYIAKLGGGAGCLLFLVLLFEFLARLPSNQESPEQKGQDFLQILITSITIIVVAVPEGLPLAVTLSLAFATKRMTRDNNLVRHLQSCETMGNATVICSDKTGTLTENAMTVVSGALGGREGLVFGHGDPVPEPAGDAPIQTKEQDKGPQVARQQQTLIPLEQLSSRLDAEFQQLLKTAVAANTTAFEREEKGKMVFVGTKTETALLDWARHCFGLGPILTERANCQLEQLFPFNSRRKCMGAVIRLPETENHKDKTTYRLFVKGAPEVVLAKCSGVMDDWTKVASRAPLLQDQKDAIRSVIVGFAAQSLRTLALAYRDLEQWPPPRPQTNDTVTGSGDITLEDVLQDMLWMGVVGIRDPVRQGVPAAVQDCRTASVSVKMVTGDNVETARAVGRECGILTTRPPEQGLVMEGQQFRQLPHDQKVTAAKDIRVLARSSPDDKRTLVKLLRDQGEIVAVTGDGTNDAPALKAADVGFAMGMTGTEVAKEASDIILMDDNFTSIVKALGWGRAINDSVKKFLQFQLTVNITAVLVTFVSAVSDGNETSVLNAVQLLWVNLIMDTFAALALATDPPAGSILRRRPEPRRASLITLTMWKMIIGQSVYQLVVCFVLWFAGPGFLGYPEAQLRTLIFNVFVFMQIFKLINSRRIDNQLNIFEGLHRNWLFMVMMSVMVAGQLVIIYVGGAAFVVVRLTGEQWAISVGLGFGSIPVGILIRLLPDAILRSCGDRMRENWPRWLRVPLKRKGNDKKAPSASPVGYNSVFAGIRDDLDFLRKVRGGRIRAFSEALGVPHAVKSSHHQRRKLHPGTKPEDRSNSVVSSKSQPVSPMFSAVGMPGIVAASVGGLLPMEPSSTSQQQDCSGGNEPSTR